MGLGRLAWSASTRLPPHWIRAHMYIFSGLSPCSFNNVNLGDIPTRGPSRLLVTIVYAGSSTLPPPLDIYFYEILKFVSILNGILLSTV